MTHEFGFVVVDILQERENLLQFFAHSDNLFGHGDGRFRRFRDVIHAGAHESALQGIDAVFELTRQFVKIFPVDRRDEDTGQFEDDFLVGFVRRVFQFDDFLEMHGNG